MPPTRDLLRLQAPLHIPHPTHLCHLLHHPMICLPLRPIRWARWRLCVAALSFAMVRIRVWRVTVRRKRAARTSVDHTPPWSALTTLQCAATGVLILRRLLPLRLDRDVSIPSPTKNVIARSRKTHASTKRRSQRIASRDATSKGMEYSAADHGALSSRYGRTKATTDGTSAHVQHVN